MSEPPIPVEPAANGDPSNDVLTVRITRFTLQVAKACIEANANDPEELEQYRRMSLQALAEIRPLLTPEVGQ